jgi:hypothetical protein
MRRRVTTVSGYVINGNPLSAQNGQYNVPMQRYKAGDILTLRILETRTPSVLKAQLVSDEFQTCTLAMHRVKPPRVGHKRFNWAKFAATQDARKRKT